MDTLFVSLQQERAIARYRIGDHGGLSLQGITAVPGEPSILNAHSRKSLLYVALRSTGHLLTLDITGDEPRIIADVDTGLDDPACLVFDPSMQFMVSSYYQSGQVTVYPLSENGALHEPRSDAAITDLHAHGAAFDVSGRFLLIPHTCPGNGIWIFRWKRGLIIPHSPGKWQAPECTGPRHLHFHPCLPVAYADNEQGNSITVFAFDVTAGKLTPLQTLPTVPSDHEGGACARMEIHPSGRYIYVANRGHDSVAHFTIVRDGSLRAGGHTQVPSNPRSFHFDPSGRWLYVAGQSADTLMTCRIDAKSGALTPIAELATGRVPWWVQTTRRP